MWSQAQIITITSYIKITNMEKTLTELKKEMEELAGQWDGDMSGRLEDQAHICGEILDEIKKIESLLVELAQN